MIRESPPKRQPTPLKSTLSSSSSGASSTTPAGAKVDENYKHQGKDASTPNVSQVSDALPENPFGGLANVPAPVAVMQGKANIVENEIPPEGDRVPPTPAAGDNSGDKTGLTPDVTTTPTGGNENYNIVEKSGVDLGLASGYVTAPAIRVLESMSVTNLKEVRDFQISRPQFGSVQWQEPVDLIDLNLANAVQFYHNEGGWVEVSVHDKEGEPKYPVGEKLNKRALVTLNNYFPRKEWSDEKKKAFGRSLKAFNEKSGATFCNYDEQRGQWQFFVNHFSKWGFHDSFFDEEGLASRPGLSLDVDKSTGAMNEDEGGVQADQNKEPFGSFLNAKGPTEGAGASSHTGRAGAIHQSVSHHVGPYTDSQQQHTKSALFGMSRVVEAAAAPDDHDMDTRAVEKTPSSPFSFQNTLAGGTPYRVAPSSSVSPQNRDVGTASVGAGVESPFSKYINHVSRSAPTSDIKHVPAYAPSLGVISSAEKGLLEPHRG